MSINSQTIEIATMSLKQRFEADQFIVLWFYLKHYNSKIIIIFTFTCLLFLVIASKFNKIYLWMVVTGQLLWTEYEWWSLVNSSGQNMNSGHWSTPLDRIWMMVTGQLLWTEYEWWSLVNISGQNMNGGHWSTPLDRIWMVVTGQLLRTEYEWWSLVNFSGQNMNGGHWSTSLDRISMETTPPPLWTEPLWTEPLPKVDLLTPGYYSVHHCHSH